MSRRPAPLRPHTPASVLAPLVRPGFRRASSVRRALARAPAAPPRVPARRPVTPAPDLARAALPAGDGAPATMTDLMAVAEIGWHYLMNGGLDLALTIFEGLTAAAPDEPYFALALGLTHDRLDDPRAAEAWYRRAGQLDPADPRPDVNRAELRIEAGDHDDALRLLARGEAKAWRQGDLALATKAKALLGHVR